MVYVNAYTVWRNYGGPEEGGWWWNAGEPIPEATIQLSDYATEEEIQAAKQSLVEKFGWDKYPSQGRYSVIGGNDFEIYIEAEPPTPFPEVRPHYE